MFVVAGGLSFDDIIGHAPMRGGNPGQASLAGGSGESIRGGGGNGAIALRCVLCPTGGIEAGDITGVEEI